MSATLLRLGAAFLLALAGLAWLGCACFALSQGLGWPLALLVLALCALLRIGWPLQLAVLLGAWRLLHWPWPLALLLAAPRLLTVLPGLLAWRIARHRHPPPLWAPYERPAPR